MRRRSLISCCLAVGLLAPTFGRAAGGPPHIANATVEATISQSEVRLTNGGSTRTWRRDALATTSLSGGGISLSTPGGHADFSLLLDGARISSDLMPVQDVSATAVEGGVRLTWRLIAQAGVGITRTVEMYEGIAGMKSQTTIDSLAPVALSGYTLDEVAAGTNAAASIQEIRGGADWRSPGDPKQWSPQVVVGDPHTGDWRVNRSAARGQALTAPGTWLSLTYPGGEQISMISERRDYASSRMEYDGQNGSAGVDLSRDLIYLGPIEETGHAENPGPGPARHRATVPGRPLALEPVFTALGANADATPWQFHQYLTEHRLAPYHKAVAFNTNNIDSNRISTGAKDDMDFAAFQRLLPAARAMGIDTFIFDDGWQARSGDWCPDSAACLEPRNAANPSKFAPRFPDNTFSAVRSALAGNPSDPSDDIALGLWMTPMEFHPSSTAFQTNPQWACVPTGDGFAAYTAAQPDSSSNEAGLGIWNPLAMGVNPDTGAPERLIDYIQRRIERAITTYGATYFKFDFLVWIDCGGAEPVDMYGYHDAFVDMVDRLITAHPNVTFETDETNDYRLFPYESVARGPSWFQNGSPATESLLHNLWSLATYVPGFSLGQAALSNSGDLRARGVDYVMAVALGSHITVWTDIANDTNFPPALRAQVKRWVDFYKKNVDALGTFTFPLLSDPLTKDWTALQPWNMDTTSGYLLAFNQASAQTSKNIPLRGIPATGTFHVTQIDPANGATIDRGLMDAVTLRAGVSVVAPRPYTYTILHIEPAA